jgi:hypothetical protein
VLWAYYPDGAVTVTGDVAAYVCNARLIGFHHCPTCGCTTHWQTLGMDFGRMAVNARLLDNFELSGVPLRVVPQPTAKVFGDIWPPV